MTHQKPPLSDELSQVSAWITKGRLPIRWLLLPALLALVLYSRTASYGFTLDDEVFYLKNESV